MNYFLFHKSIRLLDMIKNVLFCVVAGFDWGDADFKYMKNKITVDWSINIKIFQLLPCAVTAQRIGHVFLCLLLY